MSKLFGWIKTHFLASLFVGYLVFNFVLGPFLGELFYGLSSNSINKRSSAGYGFGNIANTSAPIDSLGFDLPSLSLPADESIPSETKERMVATETSLSMVVNDVNEAVKKLENKVADYGGYMITRLVSRPEEAASATLMVRVLSSELDNYLEWAKNQAVKVTMENVIGTDVTDAYEDLNAKIAIYQANMQKFNALLTQTDDIEYLLRIQKELINLQNQIDQLRGRQQLLEQTAKLAKVTFYLSSDEWSLPYAPATSFSPKVIFKQAVRSLVETLRGIAAKSIWLAVYSVIWIPLLAIILLFRKKKKSKNQPPQA